jgi:hypothetical protein
MAPSASSDPAGAVRSIRGAKSLKVARPSRVTLILMSLIGGQMVPCMSQNLDIVGPRFIQSGGAMLQQLACPAPL